MLLRPRFENQGSGASLASCASGGAGIDACGAWRPILVSRAGTLTDGTRALAHNEPGKQFVRLMDVVSPTCSYVVPPTHSRGSRKAHCVRRVKRPNINAKIKINLQRAKYK